ncbi:MAG TPA: hypothetical protein VFI61_00655 [Patescibacteria group bacterium]|nr:hypothetical protein [Patescibacteria group bacterium]
MRYQLPYKKIVGIKEAQKLAQLWRKQGLRLVATSGVFDIATFKHPEYLQAASNLGDKLIVRLDSDLHIQKNKNPQGSVIPWRMRSKHLAHYPYVDLIVPNPGGVDWIEKLMPDVSVFSITSSSEIGRKIEIMQPYFNKISTEVVVMDELFNLVPKKLIKTKALKYEKSKLNKKHISGTLIKEEIVRRALQRRKI